MTDALLPGLDVSYAQSDRRTSASLLDWQQVKQAGIGVVYTKLSEGAYIRDSAAHNHIDGQVTAGIPHRLGYHFARLAASVDANVNVFLERYRAIGEMEGAVLDFEDPNNPLDPDASTAWALGWLGPVSREIGRPSLFYTFSGYTSRFAPDPQLAQYPLIIANYGRNDGSSPPTRTPPPCPAPWATYIGWQHTSVGRLPGYSGNLDLNVFAPNFFAAPQPPPEEEDMPGPIEEARNGSDFIESLYLRIAKSEPDPHGFDYWLGLLLGGSSPHDVEQAFAAAVYAAATK